MSLSHLLYRSRGWRQMPRCLISRTGRRRPQRPTGRSLWRQTSGPIRYRRRPSWQVVVVARQPRTATTWRHGSVASEQSRIVCDVSMYGIQHTERENCSRPQNVTTARGRSLYWTANHKRIIMPQQMWIILSLRQQFAFTFPLTRQFTKGYNIPFVSDHIQKVVTSPNAIS